MAQIKGIDVSKWQGNIDWQKVKADGVVFAFIRTGYSNNYTDPYFEEYYSGAKSVGIKVGVYHYSYATTAEQAKKEAEFVLTLLKGKQFEYPIAFDIEENSQTKLGKKIITDMIVAFCETIKSAGYTPMLYTNTSWRTNYIDMTRIPYLLWQAHYTAVKPAAIDSRVAVWQYTGTGKVNGISGNVDMNWGYQDLSVSVKIPVTPPAVSTAAPKSIVNHVISTNNEIVSGEGNYFRTKQRPNHDGVDFVDKNGLQKKQDVYINAIAGGTVVDTTIGNSVGHSVSVLHEGNILSRYFHMKAGSVRVKAGQKVNKSDILGVMGTTGESTGIHLHLGIKTQSTAWSNGEYVDPMPYLRGEKTIKEKNTVIAQKDEVNLMSKEYDELKKMIDGIKADLTKFTDNSKIKYAWIDKNLPEWAKATITKLTKKGYLKGDENGKLQLSDDMLRIFVTLDRAETFGK